MHKKSVILVLLLLTLLALALSYKSLLRTIGLATLTGIDVTVEEQKSGRLFLSFKVFLNLGESQEVYAEFTNTGTSAVVTKIEERVYNYNGTMNSLAYYYDSTVSLGPGMRRGFRTVFIPSSADLYYLYVRAAYDGKKVETWAAFSVIAPQPPVIIVIPTPPGPAQPAGPAAAGAGIPKLSLVYPTKVKVYQGESTLINITAINVGDVALHNLRMYASTSELIDFDVNPKQVASLNANESTVFLISINVPSTTQLGTYPFDFDIIADETKESKKIELEVLPPKAPEAEDMRQLILNYQYLISEIEGQIVSTAQQGYDVSLANQSLNNAKASFEKAKNYYDFGNYLNAKKELDKVKKFLEDAVFQLASTTLYVRKYPAFAPLWVLLIFILIIVAVMVVSRRKKKKKEERPKLLRALMESEGGT